MRPSPERVEEIQRALAGAGELQEQPTGQWDQATRDAMARYQAANGFAVTGLPDAKSLMKLGLGPHPLPAGLDHSPARATAPPIAPNLDADPKQTEPLGTPQQ